MEKAVITLALISCLYGCIGAQLSLPEQKNVRPPLNRTRLNGHGAA
jgi:hypothetical protein